MNIEQIMSLIGEYSTLKARYWAKDGGVTEGMVRKALADVASALREALAPQPQEPVAVQPLTDEQVKTLWITALAESAKPGLLYDAQVDAVANAGFKLARAVEHAHGIGEKP